MPIRTMRDENRDVIMVESMAASSHYVARLSREATRFLAEGCMQAESEAERRSSRLGRRIRVTIHQSISLRLPPTGGRDVDCNILLRR